MRKKQHYIRLYTILNTTVWIGQELRGGVGEVATLPPPKKKIDFSRQIRIFF